MQASTPVASVLRKSMNDHALSTVSRRASPDTLAGRVVNEVDGVGNGDRRLAAPGGAPHPDPVGGGELAGREQAAPDDEGAPGQQGLTGRSAGRCLPGEQCGKTLTPHAGAAHGLLAGLCSRAPRG